MSKVFTAEEVAKHNSKDDCWVVINGEVHDLTPFLSEHPGGSKVITKYAGKDGSKAFNAVHPSDIVERLGQESLRIGRLAGAEDSKPAAAAPSTWTPRADLPPLESILNYFDFEDIAGKVMDPKGWAYYSSGADDEITLRENHAAFQRLWLRPRALRDVSNVDMSTTILGQKCALPIYLSATALARLAHPDGEQAIVRAAGSRNLVYMLPTMSSCSMDEMLGAKSPGQPLFFQLYVNQNRKVTESLVRKAEQGGCSGLFVTVDAPQLGNREKDRRFKFTATASNVQQGQDQQGGVVRDQGTSRAVSQFIDPSLNWKDIEWLKTITNMPIILKGVQCAEDAILAYENGIKGVVLSNHGGRQLDCARSGIEVLVEVMEALDKRGARDKLDVFVDGGIRRGSDVFKAIALGAKAVGIGRPVLYGLAGYGQAGVEKMLDIFADELRLAMMLMGTPTVKDAVPEMVITRNIGDHVSPNPTDFLPTNNYMPLKPASRL